MIPRLFAVLLLCALSSQGHAAATFHSLSYHDVRDDVVDDLDEDQFAVSTRTLIEHFSWLQAHDYHPVSIDDLVAARDGRRPLPDRAVLLTFDDGYASVYTKVYPLLKMFNYPAVIAIVGSWIDAPPGASVLYGHKRVPRSRFLTWQQIREMRSSGLVEVASHTFSLHRGLLANPQGNTQPAGVVRRYDPNTARYESAVQYRLRIERDLGRNSRVIAERIGVQPRVMVWPFGAYNAVAIAVARDLGMPITLTLDDGRNRVDELTAVRRKLVEANPKLAELVPRIRDQPLAALQRVVHVDLDYLYDADARQQKLNLDRLLDRIKALKITTVYLQAFADPDGDGTASALYFPNRHLPMRADLFNRVAWQLKTRAEVAVYAWIPVLAFDLPDKSLQRELMVATIAAGEPDYRRLSPFDARARQIIGEIYEDLAVSASFNGLLFHDDAYLSDFEDASAAALEVYVGEWELPGSVEAIRADPELLERWTRLKTRYLIDFTLRLHTIVERFRPRVKTARNMYAPVVLSPESETWFAQNFQDFLVAYDYTALMAMPYLEGAQDPMAWLSELTLAVARVPGALSRTVFELQSVDWRNDRPVPTSALVDQLELLRRHGARHFGYYPDDFVADHPRFTEVRAHLSASDYPYLR